MKIRFEATVFHLKYIFQNVLNILPNLRLTILLNFVLAKEKCILFCDSRSDSPGLNTPPQMTPQKRPIYTWPLTIIAPYKTRPILR